MPLLAGSVTFMAAATATAASYLAIISGRRKGKKEKERKGYSRIPPISKNLKASLRSQRLRTSHDPIRTLHHRASGRKDPVGIVHARRYSLGDGVRN